MKPALMFLACLALLFSPKFSDAKDLENYLQVKGEASVIVKPDIAHCFLKITGEGETYEASNNAANEKLAQLNDVLKDNLGEIPQLQTLRIESGPKGRNFDENYEKNLFVGVAKAMKGEEPAEKAKKKEIATSISVYFTLTKFTRESILKLTNDLADKDIAFDKNVMFDFPMSDFTFGRSMILYGVSSLDNYLESLAALAFKKAERDAKILSKAVNKKLRGLVNITGCGDLLEGDVSLSFRSNPTAKDLGPLSTDPSRLMIKFSKDFGFKIE